MNLLADHACTGEDFADAGSGPRGATVRIAKRNALRRFELLPKRWIVARSFASLEKCRRPWKNRERLLDASLQFVDLAFPASVLGRFPTGSELHRVAALRRWAEKCAA